MFNLLVDFQLVTVDSEVCLFDVIVKQQAACLLSDNLAVNNFTLNFTACG